MHERSLRGAYYLYLRVRKDLPSYRAWVIDRGPEVTLINPKPNAQFRSYCFWLGKEGETL